MVLLLLLLLEVRMILIFITVSVYTTLNLIFLYTLSGLDTCYITPSTHVEANVIALSGAVTEAKIAILKNIQVVPQT